MTYITNSIISEAKQGGKNKVIQRELVKRKLKEKTSLDDLQIHKVSAAVEEGLNCTIRNIETEDELVKALQLRSTHISDDVTGESGELELGRRVFGDIAFGLHSTQIASQEAGCIGNKTMKKPVIDANHLVVFVKRKIKWFSNLEKGIYRNEEQDEIIIYDPIVH